MVIGIIEDDNLLRKALDTSLQNQGYTTILAGSRKEAIKNIDRSVDLLIVDIGLPDGDGINLYQELQKNGRIPAIFLTAKDDEKDMLKAFDIGADDYVTKPFRPLELLARVNSHLRRYSRFLNMVKHEEENTNVFEVGGLELNTDTKEVILDGKSIRMTPSEFKILELLIRNPGRVFSAEEIYERVWNEQAINTDTIMVHVRNIREKIEINPKKPKYLKVVWGVGYKLEKQ